MKFRSYARQRGLSLVELLLGLALTALVLAPLVPMLQTASATTRAGGDRVTIEREASFALDRIAARIRATAVPDKISGTPVDWLQPTVYVVSNGTLIEQQGKVSYVLAESVTDFSLAAPPMTGSQPLVQITMTLARNGATTTASTIVRLGSLL
jgi:Tfp pilus assembly protein PilW